MTMQTILVVHHDADLYGSDKSLLRSVRAMLANGILPIVALPHEGPLVELLRAEGAEVHIGPVGKLTRRMLRPLALPFLAWDLLMSFRFLGRIIAGRSISLVYSNSVAALGGAIWAALHRVPRLWHVREIVVEPKIAARWFPQMLNLLGGWCVCNSHATRRWLTDACPALVQRSSVIWNGLENMRPPSLESVAAFRTSMGFGPDDVVVTLVGRINRWKGQHVLIDAAAHIRQQGMPGLKFLIVGDVADGQDHYRDAMLAHIQRERLEQEVLWQPFTTAVDVVWAASDIAVVPSTEAEPFGRVAIEAMSHSLPVIAAAHGGLVEIVEAGRTGLLVTPGNAQELADAISRLALAHDLRKALGVQGRERQQTYFSQTQHDQSLMALLNELTTGSAKGANKTVRMLGTHGVPANYGGFETAAENIALYLVQHGWRVIVYCQADGDGPIIQDVWRGIERVTIPVKLPGWKGTSHFDWLCIKHAGRFNDLCLTFGYNTALFSSILRMKGIPNVINMDGIEWSRARWGFMKQAILYVNERIACIVGNHLIADHPEIEKYLLTRAPQRKITTLTYGADPVPDVPTEFVTRLGLVPGRYMTLIARPIPENSILEMVEGFSATPRGIKLAILGKFEPKVDLYHARVLAAASQEIVFLGAIYDKAAVQALRFHCMAYVHGHTVGGTNPSLVEAMGAGNAVIAHDNPYNRWVAQDAAIYFQDAASFSRCVDRLLTTPTTLASLRDHGKRRFAQEFTWEHVAGQYEQLLLQHLPGASNAAAAQMVRYKTQVEGSGHTAKASPKDFLCEVEGLSVTKAGVFVFGWAFSLTETIARVVLQRNSDALLATGNICKWNIRRDDVGTVHAGQPQAGNSGFFLFADLGANQRNKELALSFEFFNGEQRTLPLSLADFSHSAAGDSPARARRWMFVYSSSIVWRMLKERKFRAIAVGMRAKWRHMPVREDDAVGKVMSVLRDTGNRGCMIIIDHDVGGGANAYREKVIEQQLASGNAVALVTFHLLSVHWSIELVTRVSRNRWVLDGLDSIAHLARRGLVTELFYNTAVSFPNPIHIPVLLRYLREVSGAKLTVAIHDYFPICPSHYLLNAKGAFCNVPDLVTCRACLAKHSDPYVKLHRSRDIDHWRRAWGAFLTAADQIICFSNTSLLYLKKAYPSLVEGKIEVRPHKVDYLPFRPFSVNLDGPLCIGIVGKIGYSKGAEIVRGLAAEIQHRGIDVRIAVIGTLEVSAPGHSVSETGPYRRHEFVDLVERSGANVFLFPSIWPETFSYVAEELMHLKVPLMCFNIGAPAERVREYDRGRVADFESIPLLLDDLIDFHKDGQQSKTTQSSRTLGLGHVQEELR